MADTIRARTRLKDSDSKEDIHGRHVARSGVRAGKVVVFPLYSFASSW